ncbi:type VI secretion system baseplate subunit TssG [Massilia horti]|uniref:Type VI secretion system baseplate subunit TssG n=1 Tax=Massilia horti TaxID=2562153 RepID=A0A4Y9T3Z1_9BURK|nr:type VI secretion system baseplate subunit TssG [Massilia horti]TFW31773.1 type VI secretion system baseplate subunit TssG [Massilia horti]
MPTPNRRFESSLIERLFAEPYRFQFAQAVRLLELWLGKAGASGETLQRTIRFRNSTSLAFPPSELEAVQVEDEDDQHAQATLIAALAAGRGGAVWITPTFIGLLGSHGALPLHYTESIVAQATELHGDGARAFFDMMSSRTVALFHRAYWAYRVHHNATPDGADRFLPLQLALAGSPECLSTQQRASTRVPADVRAYYSAVLRHRPVSAALIERVLSDYFQLQVAVEQCAGRWDELPPDRRTRLGVANTFMKRGAILGSRCWRRDLTLRLRLGPLAPQQYEDFLPGREGTLALAEMVALLNLPNLRIDVTAILRAEGALPARIGADACGRLGWDAFLLTTPESRDRPDLCYPLPI